MSTQRFGRGQKAMALVPLALLSAAWTASLAGVNAPLAAADDKTDPTLPDGTTLPTRAIKAPASVSVPGGLAPGVHGDPGKVVASASTSGIPAAALAAYQRAETVINTADKSCHLPWQLIAAIGRVESDHGRSGGNSLDSHGVARPGIYGVPLDGHGGTTRISDTDAGQYDADAKLDRAVGPMQFIPSTWSVVGVDADGDGKRNPQDVDDAALASAVYLCSGDEDLSTTAGQRTAVYRYNHSRSYVDLVLSIMNAYLDGEFTSVPNGTTSAGYVVPDPVAPTHTHGPKHQQAPHQEPHATQTSGSSDDGTDSGSTGGETSAPAPSEPTPTPAPTDNGGDDDGGDGGLIGGLLGGGGSGGGDGGGGSGGGGGDTGDDGGSDGGGGLLTQTQARLQCLAENPLLSGDALQNCILDLLNGG